MPSVLLVSSLAPLLLWSGLLAGPPSLPPTPTEAVPEAPVLQQPEPTAEATPGTEPTEPTEPPAEIGPEVAPEPTVEVAPLAPPELAPGLDAEDDDDRYVTVRPPRWRGTGILIGAGALYAAAIAFQAGDSVLCGDCATGVIERIFLFGSMGMAAGGAVMRGHADAYDDTALRRDRPDTRKTLIAGAVLTGAGAVMGLVNEGLWWSCVVTGDGPYETNGDFNGTGCNYLTSRALLDIGTATTAAGLGLLSWSLTYSRDARAYQRARVIGLRPTLGRDRWGLGVGGRF
jgi:hypothetical protein